MDSCPEKAIAADFGSIALNPKWFEDEIMAKDLGFACVECGKVFANQKAIQKVVSMMQPFFAQDPLKLKSLKCCEDCKVKIMFGVS